MALLVYSLLGVHLLIIEEETTEERQEITKIMKEMLEREKTVSLVPYILKVLILFFLQIVLILAVIPVLILTSIPASIPASILALVPALKEQILLIQTLHFLCLKSLLKRESRI